MAGKNVMNKFIRCFVVLVTINTSISDVFAQGSTVTVHLKDRRAIKGELFYVRDSAVVVLCSRSGGARVDSVVLLMNEISSVMVQGKSRVPAGIALGALLGSFAGALAAPEEKGSSSSPNGFNTNSPSETDFYTTAGFALGAGLGWAIGWAASQPDVKFDLLSTSGRDTLRTYSKYSVSPKKKEFDH